MENKKSYIEFFYIQPNINPIMRFEVKNRDPLQVEYDDIAVAFRFLDFDGKNFLNYSCWYFLGEELTIDEAFKRLGHIDIYQSKLLEYKNSFVKKICMTRLDNLVPMSLEDTTLENYKKQYDKKELIKA